MEVEEMAFEIYKPRGEKEGKLPLVTLSKNSIVLNKQAREKINSEKVELAYDKETNTIRIKGTENGGQFIKKTKVFGKGFFNFFDIVKRGKFIAKFDESENALIVELNQTSLR